jgi:hypothetical protein
MNYRLLFFLCFFTYNAIAANMPYDAAKISTWAGDTHPNSIQNIVRYIRVILGNIPQNAPTTGKFNATLSKYCKGSTTNTLDPNIEILRTWPEAGGNCAQKQYDLVMESLSRYDAQQVRNREAEIASLRIVIQRLRDLNRRLKTEVTALESFIAEDLERIIRTYIEYVNQTEHTFQTHNVHLQEHLTELNRLSVLIQGNGAARGMIADIEAAQAESTQLLADAEHAGNQEMTELRQQVENAQAIIDATTLSLAALQQHIEIIHQTFNH